MGVLRRLVIAMSTAVCVAACSSAPSGEEQSQEQFEAHDVVDLDPGLSALLGSTPSEGALDKFWRTQELGADVRYEAPRDVLAYAAGEVPEIACRDALTADGWTDNAFYCAEDQTIAFDADFVAELGERFGDFAGVAVVAHEWGHHLAGLRRTEQTASFSVQRELEADCLAGVFTAGHESETGDVTSYDDFARTFFLLGSEEFDATSWFGAGEHGSPNQRLVAWSLGYLSQVDGVSFCSGYAQWQPTAFAELDGWLVRPLPGAAMNRIRRGIAFDAGNRLPPWRMTAVSTVGAKGAEAALRGWLSQTYPDATFVVDVGAFDLDGIDAAAVVATASGTHVVGLDGRQLEAGRALVYDVLAGASGDVPDAAVFTAWQTMMNAAAWVCAPGQSVDPESDEYDLMCNAEL